MKRKQEKLSSTLLDVLSNAKGLLVPPNYRVIFSYNFFFGLIMNKHPIEAHKIITQQGKLFIS